MRRANVSQRRKKNGNENTKLLNTIICLNYSFGTVVLTRASVIIFNACHFALAFLLDSPNAFVCPVRSRPTQLVRSLRAISLISNDRVMITFSAAVRILLAHARASRVNYLEASQMFQLFLITLFIMLFTGIVFFFLILNFDCLFVCFSDLFELKRNIRFVVICLFVWNSSVFVWNSSFDWHNVPLYSQWFNWIEAWQIEAYKK